VKFDELPSFNPIPPLPILEGANRPQMVLNVLPNGIIDVYVGADLDGSYPSWDLFWQYEMPRLDAFILRVGRYDIN
jgi:hypothetical protein